MSDYDFFELTGLSFDPPVTDCRKIKSEAEKKINELTGAANGESQAIKRDEIEAQKKFLLQTLATILTPDGKKFADRSQYNKLAAAKVALTAQQFTAMIQVMKATGTDSITDRAVKEYRRTYKLSEDSIKKVLAQEAVTVQPIQDIDVSKLFPQQIAKAEEYFTALRNTPNPNSSGPNTAEVTNFYIFAAFLKNDLKNAALYEAKSTSELQKFFTEQNQALSIRNDPFGKICANLASNAKTYVFDSEKSREAYTFHLKYSTPALKQIFDLLPLVPALLRTDSRFAEPCIAKIISVLGCDDKTARSVYNRESKSEYQPEVPVYLTLCHHCGNVSRFPTEAKAVKANKCTSCGQPLFRACPNPKCRQTIRTSHKLNCPVCNYSFLGPTLFNNALIDAAAALREDDFATATRALNAARKSLPALDAEQKAKVETLEAEVRTKEAQYKKPLGNLRVLTLAKKYIEAQSLLPEIARTFPNLNLSDTVEEIRAALTAANVAYNAAKDAPPAEKANACYAVLDICADHSAAMDYLRNTPPAPCSQIRVIPNAKEGWIHIDWGRSKEKNVKYCLVRKRGETCPVSITDGTVLKPDTDVSCCDKTVVPGTMYCYAIFIIRGNLVSAPISKRAVVYTEVRNLVVSQLNNTLQVSWILPKNCIGVTVKRVELVKSGATMQSRTETTLTLNAHNSYTDTTFRFHACYLYKVYANYPNGMYSEGIESMPIIPTPFIEPFEISAKEVRNSKRLHWDITWQIPQPDIDLRIVTDQGNVLATTTTSSSNIQLAFDANITVPVRVEANSAGQWIPSKNTCLIDTYSPIEIDKEKIFIEDRIEEAGRDTNRVVDMKIPLSGEIPKGVTGFYYTVRTKEPYWSRSEDIATAADMKYISIADYKRQKGIPFQGNFPSERVFRVTVMAAYNQNGKTVYSPPAKTPVTCPLKATLYWKYSKVYKQVTITVHSATPLERIPGLVLCSYTSKTPPASYTSPEATLLLQIPEVNPKTIDFDYTESYPLTTKIPGKAQLALYEMMPVQKEIFTITEK